MRRTRTLILGTIAVGCALAVAPGPAAAQFAENALGRITASGSTVRIHTGELATPHWFGLRVFTVPGGTMASHNVLRTSKTGFAYDGTGHAGGKVLCVSDFQGTGSPSGGAFGPASALGAGGDPFVAMLGGFAGKGTGCTDGSTGDIIIGLNTTGPVVQAFYGAFYGTSAADWRGPAGDTFSNPAWWNLWGNFTELGFGSTG